jgi:DNA mismatch endonuclease, patch repair protein
MTDVVNKITRSRMMSGIRGTNTTPEKYLRSLLHRKGFRFSLHRKDLLGKPDIVLPKYGAVIFVHGCFWHRHLCHLFKWPKSNTDFWQNKINANAVRDVQNAAALLQAGWRVLNIWECSLKGRHALLEETLSNRVARWLTSKAKFGSIPRAPVI